MSAPSNPVPFALSTDRLALRRSEAAARLSVSDEVFDKHVRPHLRTVRFGNGQRAVRIYPVHELVRFLEEHADHPLEDA